MKIRKKNEGFTLIEMLIYSGVLILLLAVLSQIFSLLLETQLEAQSISSIEQDGRFILLRLTRDIKDSSEVLVPENPGASANNLQIVVNGETYSYFLINSNLIMQNDSGMKSLNSYDSRVSNLSFLRLGQVGGKNSIKIAFTLSSISQRKTGSEVKTFETTASLR